MWHLQLVLVSWCCCSGVICVAVSVLEGESVTIDCGFQTTVNGGNLLWQFLSNGSEIPLGYIVPGDHFCGIDYIECTVHSNGSITLFNVSLSDGEKYYRCLRGDKEGYHYFSNVSLTVVSKESLGHPVIQPLTEPKGNVYMIKEEGVIHSYEQPTCEDKEDGALMITCYPPSGLIVDKVYHQVHCNCTDSDGYSESLNITVKSHAELKKNSVAVIAVIIIQFVTIVGLLCIVIRYRHIYQLHKAKNARNPENVDVCCSPHLGKGTTGGSNHSLHQHEEEGLQLNLDTDDVSQRLKDKEAECRDKSDEIAKLKEENQNKDTTISDLVQRMIEKDADCTAKSEEIYKLKEINLKKDTTISDLTQRMIEKDADCTAKSEEIYKLKEINLKKDMESSGLRQRLNKKEAESAGESKDIYNLIRMNQLKDLSKKIGREWNTVGKNLGLKEAGLHNMRVNYKECGHQEVVYQMLLKWKLRNGSSATIRALAEALKKSERRDLHDELIVYKIETELNMLHKMLLQQLLQHPLLSQDKKEKKKAGREDKDEARPKEVTAIDQVKDEKEEKNECEKDKDEEKP